ncbi:MAG: ATP-dependent protease subunit HslV [Candidatus Poribacteria bacterium]|nr:ATP-dependent protease subunit HslV [Candidatus Poribacteria bacterium]
MIKSTTILAVRRDNQIAIGGDGQVTLGDTAIKHGAKKIRRVHEDSVLLGFAGTASDALTLYENLETKLEQYRGNLQRAAVELARDWRSDRVLRRVDALMIAIDSEGGYLISGAGDVISPDDDVLAIGSGGSIALAAAKALLNFSSLSARDIVQESLKITSRICIYSNDEISIESIES